jgi:hypothetical protein
MEMSDIKEQARTKELLTTIWWSQREQKFGEVRENKNLVMGADGAKNKEWLLWWGPAAIYCFAVPCS